MHIDIHIYKCEYPCIVHTHPERMLDCVCNVRLARNDKECQEAILQLFREERAKRDTSADELMVDAIFDANVRLRCSEITLYWSLILLGNIAFDNKDVCEYICNDTRFALLVNQTMLQGTVVDIGIWYLLFVLTKNTTRSHTQLSVFIPDAMRLLSNRKQNVKVEREHKWCLYYLQLLANDPETCPIVCQHQQKMLESSL